MPGEKIAIRITPTPATQDISHEDILRLSRITKLPPEKIKERISKGKSTTILTLAHPRIDAVIDLIRSMGFSVTTGPPQAAGEPPAPFVKSGRLTQSPVVHGEWKVGDVVENLYEVLEIKQGGMGAVYIVRHLRWNTMLAVKSLLERLRDNEEDRALFTKEAETWIDIGFHPNIAACYYVRNILESPRIFIEYVDGGALGEWLRRHKHVGWDLLIDLMVQVSDGLQHAHSKGLVHRDVKPGNCMMTKDGVLKVTDFGLTKRRSADGVTDYQEVPEAVVLERESITAAGMGTPAYMAPEMWIPHCEVGPQADIYAFGIMFFELCCGRKPFIIKPGEKRDKLAIAHVKKAPPRPSTFREGIPGSMEEIILTCLNKNPTNRYPSFRAIRELLVGAYEEITKRKFAREAPDEVRLLADALNNRAVSLIDLNHREEAVSALEKALESDPHHPEAIYNHGIMNWMHTGDPDWDVIIKLEEAGKTPEYVGRGSHLLARCLLTLGDAPRALKACELALTAEDASEEWLKAYGIALIGSGKEKDAIVRLENYLADFPNDDEALGWLIGALVRSGEVEKVRERMKSPPKGSNIALQNCDEIAGKFLFSGLEETLILSGHAGWITCVAHFPKTQALITGARDRTLKVWDRSTGLEKKNVQVLGEPPAALWISPNERLVAVGSAQSGVPIKLLDLDSGRFIGNVQAHEGSVTALAFSPDGTRVLIVEAKGTARLWEISKFKVEATFKLPPHSAAAVVSPDIANPELIVAGLDRVLKKVRPIDSDIQTFERGHRDSITHLKSVPNGSRILSYGRDKQIIVWDGASGGIVTVFQAHQETVTELALNPVRRLAASCDPKIGIKVWDYDNGFVFRTFPPGEGEIACIDFLPDGSGLVSGGRDMSLRIWDVRGRPVIADMVLARIRPVTKQLKSDRKLKAMIEAAQKAIKRGAYTTAYSLFRESQSLHGYERSDSALELIVSMRDHGTRIALHGGWKKKTLETSSAVRDVKFSPSAINFVTAHADHSIRMWSSKTGDCIKMLKGHTNLVAAISYSVNGRELISGSDDRSVRMWDIHAGRSLHVLKGHADSVSCVAYAKTGDLALSGSWDSTIRLWRIPDGALFKTLKGHEDKITSAAFVNGTEHVLSAGFDGVIKMWNVPSGRILRDLKGHRNRIMGLSVSPREDLLLSGSTDGTVRVWDLRTGACVRTVEVSESGVRTVAFSPDEKFFVVGANDAVLSLWELENGTCLREFQGHTREITAAEFSSNGRFVITSSSDGNVMIWEVDWEWDFEDQKVMRSPTQIV